MTRILRRVGVFVFLLFLAAFVVDRLSLVVWRFRIERYAEKLRRAAANPDVSKQGNRPVLSASHDTGPWRVPYLEVMVAGPKPSWVTVDGNGGLNFFYLPPLTAWSRHLPFLGHPRPVIQGSDVFAYNDVYTIKIWTLESRPAGKPLARPSVVLEHGLPF